MTTAAGFRVYFPERSRTRVGQAKVHIDVMSMRYRDPERQWPPDLIEDVPSPLDWDDPAGKKPIELAPIAPPSQHRSLWTIGQFVRYASKGMWRSITRRKASPEEQAILLRELFERLSGIWIKAGQLMSLRTDVMSPEVCRELSKLQFEAKGFPLDVARKVLEEELGKPINAVFSHFEPHPFAAATVAQVHRATLLENNRAVIVKIMRPDVAKSFQRDLALFGSIVRFARAFGLWKQMNLGEAIRELRNVLLEETNYEQEAVNIRKMRKSLREHGIYVPRVVSRLSSRRVLVMEEVPGVLMSHYLRVRRDDPARADAWALQNGVDVEEVARHLAISVLRQILEDNQFHGDLHPGNIIMLADNGLALIDFGSIGRLDRKLWHLYSDSLKALAMKDYDRAADLMLMMSPMSAQTNIKAARRDMVRAMQQWEMSSQYADSSYQDRSINGMADGISKAMAKHRVAPAWGIMRVGRTLSTLDASMQTLWPNADFGKLARAYFRDRQERTSNFKSMRERLQTTLMEVASFSSDARILLGSGLREQALRINGVMDRVTHVRLVIATWGGRLSWAAFLVLIGAAYLDEGRDRIQIGGEWPGAGFLHIYDLADAVPDFHPIHWFLMMAVSISFIRFFRATKRSLVGNDF